MKNGITVRVIGHNVARTVRKLGTDFRIASLRRRWSQRDMAPKMGVSVGSVQRMESGDPSVSLGTIASAFLAFWETCTNWKRFSIPRLMIWD